MLKILLALDAINPEKNAIAFGCYIANLSNSKLTGVFLENLVENQATTVAQLYEMNYVDMSIYMNSLDISKKGAKIEMSIELFKNECKSRNVDFDIHYDYGFPVEELINESRYADLLIIDADTSFYKKSDVVPSKFVKDILKRAKCPVFVAPENFERIDEIVFAYDGSDSALFAIKQFTYLFPQFSSKKASVIQVYNENETKEENNPKFLEWLNNHYTHVNLEDLYGKADHRFIGIQLKRKNIVIVIGAYGRSLISQFFRHSDADLLMKIKFQPLFISHL